MRGSCVRVLMLLIVATVGNGALAASGQTGVGGSPDQGLLQPAQEQEAEGQDPGAGQDDSGGQGEAESTSIDPASLPEISLATTDEQEAALRLVENILAEQRLLLSGQNFVYQAGGRRDPFRSLLAVRRREAAAPELRPAGIAGLLINEVAIAATASYQGRWQAMIVGFNQRTYFVQVGAVLYDGRVVEISGDEVIFEQDVEDLLGARSTQRVSKRLVTGNQEY